LETVQTHREFDRALARLRRKRMLRLVVPPLALVLLTLGADAVWQWRTRVHALGRAGEAWSAYASCVLGAPLRDGERATGRLSRIEMNLPEPQRGPGVSPNDIKGSEAQAAWPSRCAYHLDEIHAALTQGRLTKNKKLAQLDEVARAARVDLAPADAPDLADHLWASIAQAALPVRPTPPPPGDPPAPAPAEPLTAASLPPLPVEVQAAPEEADRIPGDGLRIMFAPPSGDSSLCSFRPDAHGTPFRTAHCADNIAPTATDDATPGFLRSVKGRFDRFELIRPLLGADPQIVSIPAGTQAIGLFADQLVSVTSGHHLMVRTVPQGAGELGASVDLGPVAGSSPELAACRTETSLVVRVRSYDDAAGLKRVWATIALRTGSSWERVPEEVAVQVDADFTCRGREATFTWLERDTIHQARCTPAGCVREVSDPLALPWDSGRPNRVTDIDGKAMLVGIGMTAGPVAASSVKTVRMRVAPVAEIAQAPDIVLIGDPAHDGVDVSDVHVYVRRGGALVLITSNEREPYRAIAVAANGAFDPLRVEKL
jgi:hypothetical protein